MIEQLVSFLQAHIIPIGAFGIFFASIIEEVIAPIPSAFVLLTGGFLFLSHQSGFHAFTILLFKIAIPAAFGITLGSLFIYWLTYTFGKPIIDRYGKWFGVRWEDIQRVEKWFEKGPRDDVFIFVVRAMPFIPSVAIGSFAGIMRLNLRTYILSSLAGTTLRAMILATVGWQMGNLYYKYADIISRFETDILYTIIFLVLVFVMYKRRKNSA